MSNRALTAVIDGCPPSNLKPVLVILANRASKDSGACYLSMESIAYETGFSVRFVRNAIRELEAAGWLRSVRGGGQARANFYVVAVERLEPLAAARREQRRRRRDGGDGGENPAPRAEYRDTGPGTDEGVTRHDAQTYPAPDATYSARGAHTRHVVPTNHLEPQGTAVEEPLSALTRGDEASPPSGHQERRTISDRPEGRDGFEAFWLAYPRKVAKAAAAKAWEKATALADPETIVAAAARYAKVREAQDPKFTLHPGRWLNEQRWTDEHPPTAPPPTPAERRHEARAALTRSISRAADALAGEADWHDGPTIDGTARSVDPEDLAPDPARSSPSSRAADRPARPAAPPQPEWPA